MSPPGNVIGADQPHVNINAPPTYAQPEAPQGQHPLSYYPLPSTTYSYPYPQHDQAATYASTSYHQPVAAYHHTPYVDQGPHVAHPQRPPIQNYYPPSFNGWPSQHPSTVYPSYVQYSPQVPPEHQQAMPAYEQYPAMPAHHEAQTAGQSHWHTTNIPYHQVQAQNVQEPSPQFAASQLHQEPLSKGQLPSPSSHQEQPHRVNAAAREASADEKQSNKRKRDSSPPKERPKVVFVWDLDETLIIFQSLLSGKFADLEGLDEKQKEEGLKLGADWEKLILDVSDTLMFFEQVEEVDQPSISQVTEFDDGAPLGDFSFEELKLEKPLTDAGRRKLAYLYRHIQALYAKGASNLLTREKRSEWQALYGATDRFTGGWLSAGRRLLQECSASPAKEGKESEAGASQESGRACLGAEGEQLLPEDRVIVLVSSGQLIPTLTKCLLFRLDPWIDPLNVYSSKNVGKLQCFEWLEKRFQGSQSNTRFYVVGDGVEEQAAAQMMKWPFFRIASGMSAEMRLPNVKVERLMELIVLDNKLA